MILLINAITITRKGMKMTTAGTKMTTMMITTRAKPATTRATIKIKRKRWRNVQEANKEKCASGRASPDFHSDDFYSDFWVN